MTSITTAARIAVLFAIALMFATPLCPRLLALDDHNPVGVTGAFEGVITTGCAFNVLNHNATRQIDDIVVPGSIGKYPLKMTRYYNTRSTISYGTFGPGWSHEYLWGSGDGKVEYPNGNVWDSSCTWVSGLSGPLGVSDWTTTRNGNPAFRLADGGTIVFGPIVVNGTTYHTVATEIIDPYGQTTTITYYPNSLLMKWVTEAGGRYLQFTYNGWLVTRVDAYDGQGHLTDYVVYHYSSVSPGGTGSPVQCLTSVDYSDGTHASYTYRTDNVPEHQGPQCPCSTRTLPLVSGCDDARYHGSMRRIVYEYQDQGPHGAILKERYWDGVAGHEGSGEMVSGIDPPAPSPLATDPNFDTMYTEYRGDGPTRRFTYTELHLSRPRNNESEVCPTIIRGPAPQQFLTDYTDFQGNTTHLGYDTNWYVSSVRDANNHTTSYARGSPPPAGIGEIRTITHPGGNHINYTYQDESPNISGHYVHTVSNERQKVTTYTRDPTTPPTAHLVTRIDYPSDANTPASHEEFTYNRFGQILDHRLKNGAWEHFDYDGRGLLTDKYNPKLSGVPGDGDPHIHYSYYTSGPWTDRVQTMTLPANVTTNVASETYEYDRAFDGNVVTNLNGAAVAGRGLVTKITHADGKYQRFKYDAYGNKRWEDNELRKITQYTYDDYNRLLSVTDPLSKTTQHDYATTQGNTTQSQRHTSNSARWIRMPTGVLINNIYDENFRKTSTITADGTLNLRTRFLYDLVGNLTDVADPRSKVTHNGYDNRNRKTSTTEAYNTPLAVTTVWHYDAANNINQIDRPDGIHETKGFDALNRMIWHTVPRQVPGGNPINLTTHIYYNPSGTIDHVTDARGKVTSFQYNASDEKITMTYPLLPGQNQADKQTWVWDNAHNLASRKTVRGGNEIQRFAYDTRNRKTDMSWDNSADSAHYTYYADSRLNTASNSNSTVTRNYDDAGHLSLDQQYIPGLGTKSVNYPTYDDDGRLTQMNVGDAGYDYTYSYDAAGRFWKIFVTGQNNASFEYAYDAASNETHRYSYLNGVDQIYNRDSLNRMASRLLKKNGATITGTTESYTYDHMNRITEANRAGTADDFGYYWDGELLSAQYGGGPHAPYTEEQEPDLDTTDTLDPNAGYQPPETAEAEPAPPPDDTTPPDQTPDTTPSPDVTPPSDTPPAEDPAKGEKTVEDYLGDGNLAPPDGPEPDLFTGRSVMYNLDKAGNRTSVTDNVNGNATYAPNDLNQYRSVGGSSVTNGPEHEIRTYNTVTYYYINDEHLKQVTSNSSTYNLYYDALGRCVKRTLNGFTTYYIYDGEKPIVEYRSSDLSHPAKNVYGKGIDEILMRFDPSFNPDVTYYYQQDHEGSVTQLLNTSGNVIESYKYDAFGAPAIYDADGNQLSSSAFSNRFLFTGREYANVFGFYEYRARAYNPTLGRFMSEDPKGFVRRAGLGKPPDDWSFAAHPDEAEFNLFRYCGNDPVDFADPMGLDYLQVEYTSVSTPVSAPGQRDVSGHVYSGTMTWRTDEGKVVSSYHVNSGGYKASDSKVAGAEVPTFPGKYSVDNLREDRGGLMRRDGVGFSLDVNPKFRPERGKEQTLMRIHPDGGEKGTHGCLGVCEKAEKLRDFVQHIKEYFNSHKDIELRVRELPPVKGQ